METNNSIQIYESELDLDAKIESEYIKDTVKNCQLDANGNTKEEGFKSSTNTPEDDRFALFQKALAHEKDNDLDAALQCYLHCIKDLKGKNHFAQLPQCLHKIAEIYRQNGNIEKAIHYTRVENFVNITYLMNSNEIQKKIDEIAGDSGVTPQDLNELNLEALKADDFECLAKQYLDQKQQDLALQFAGKSTKLRQQIYGKNHEKTKSSFNFFATLYADIMRKKYTDTQDVDFEADAAAFSKSPEVIMSPPAGGEPVSILRQRSVDVTKEGNRGKKQVHFHESVEETQRHKEKDELASMKMTLILSALCMVILGTLGLWLFCSISKGKSCQKFMSLFSTWFQALKYYIRLFTTPPEADT
ncbi:uncharacterized protein LOC131958272 [Physella acuta]|uniref:uncharacterized protein LOC131958272 n=1 Tax=Physella acuta TaxID=109671 RepID=UPI0027DB58DB|nr:uncharacterized protein LOC131958272 [Physella acuta]